MKRLMSFLLTFMLALAINAQTYATVKREGGYTNIRRGPGTNYGIVKKVRDGSGIYVGGYTGGWYEVYSGPNGRFIGYISSSKVVFNRNYNSASSGLYSVQVKREGGYTNIRRGPGTGYGIVDKVRDGSYIYINGQFSNGWAKVFYSNGSFRGWISRSKIYVQ